ncbi:unnamed protein product, partial [Symbiodinium pilosum]
MAQAAEACGDVETSPGSHQLIRPTAEKAVEEEPEEQREVVACTAEIFNEAFPAEPADTVFSSAEEVLDLGPDIPWEFAPEAVSEEHAPKQAANQHPMSVEARGGLLVAHSPAEDTSAGLLQCMHQENMLVGPVMRQ